jgi:hypothetical protein
LEFSGNKPGISRLEFGNQWTKYKNRGCGFAIKIIIAVVTTVLHHTRCKEKINRKPKVVTNPSYSKFTCLLGIVHIEECHLLGCGVL